MEVKRGLDFDDLDSFFWSGARDRWNDATDDQKERVWDLIKEVFAEEVPTETEVNDFVWFECDDIFNEKDEDEEVEESKKHCSKESTHLDDEDVLWFVESQDALSFNDKRYYMDIVGMKEDPTAVSSRDILNQLKDNNYKKALASIIRDHYDEAVEDEEEIDEAKIRRFCKKDKEKDASRKVEVKQPRKLPRKNARCEAVDMDKPLWEGWTPMDYVKDNEMIMDMIMSGRSNTYRNDRIPKNKAELKKAIMDNCTPNVPKLQRAVVDFFAKKYGLR